LLPCSHVLPCVTKTCPPSRIPEWVYLCHQSHVLALSQCPVEMELPPRGVICTRASSRSRLRSDCRSVSSNAR
jgi:hypothetical protein